MEDEFSPLEPLLDTRAAAKLLGCSVKTIQNLVKTGELPTVAVFASRRRLRFLKADMARFIERRTIRNEPRKVIPLRTP